MFPQRAAIIIHGLVTFPDLIEGKAVRDDITAVVQEYAPGR
jgi:hypothetical protein